jgi:hypothetical protein
MSQLFVQIGDRIAVLYRKNEDNFRGRKFSVETGKWNKTSTIPLSDITCWRSINPADDGATRLQWKELRTQALAVLPESEKVDDDVTVIRGTPFTERAEKAKAL